MNDVPSPRAQMLDIYRQLRLIRRFDEVILDLRRDGEVDGVVHPYLGQEAVAVGVCADLGPADSLTSTHRGHGHSIAKGARPDRMMAELFGRSTGYCGGKGGSMHVADFSVGMLGANGIVAAGLPIATGAALAAQMTGSDAVTVCMFGDGAAGAGPVHESFNIAALWQLPVIYVCENNGWAAGNAMESTFAPESVAALANVYGLTTEIVDGNDVLQVAAVASRLIASARAGGGPALIEARTFRQAGHAYRGTDVTEARDPEVVRAGMERDPIARFARHLTDELGIEPARLAELDASVENELTAAVEFARQSPWPTEEEALKDVFDDQ